LFRFKLTIYYVLLLALLPLFGVTQVAATELVYTPINPTFGGNPYNAQGLMSIAQAQNSYTAPALTPIESFNLSLQRAILSRLTSQTLSMIFGTTNVLATGSYDTPGYLVEVTDDHQGTLNVTTTDKISGDVSSFEVTKP
jgi:curli production assembly/transport component CsgF